MVKKDDPKSPNLQAPKKKAINWQSLSSKTTKLNLYLRVQPTTTILTSQSIQMIVIFSSLFLRKKLYFA